MGLVEHGSTKEAEDVFLAKLKEAFALGSWMACVWGVKDGRLVVFAHTRGNFETGDFERAVEALKNSCGEEIRRLEKPPPAKPLPPADFLHLHKPTAPPNREITDGAAPPSSAEIDLALPVPTVKMTEEGKAEPTPE